MAKRKHGRRSAKRGAGKSPARRHAGRHVVAPVKEPRRGLSLDTIDSEEEPTLDESAEPGEIERSTSQKAAEQPEDLEEPDWEK